MKVYSFEGDTHTQLSDLINAWLLDNPTITVVEMKYLYVSARDKYCAFIKTMVPVVNEIPS